MRFLLLCLLLFSQGAHCQIDAFTREGRKVILYPDGFWRYAAVDTGRSYVSVVDSIIKRDTLKLNPGTFRKYAPSTRLVKSAKTTAAVWVNNDDWGIQKAKINESGEWNFINRTFDCVGVMVTEKTTDLDYDDMIHFVLQNAMATAADAEVHNVEYRVVNGTKVMSMELSGTIRRLKFAGVTYVYMDENGITQLFALSQKKRFAANRMVLEEFLNGFTLQAGR
ncbi:MAG: hypothetical protein EOO15_11410 [Chitinophagaceae bacterium]|nr:MAG: hypothetical protein EOO15_11410 [Chitinophagaceae bacterium]